MSEPSGPVMAYVGLGANLGDCERTLRAAVHELHRPPQMNVDFAGAVASLYQTSPVGGPPDQPDFLNSCLRLATHLGPHELFATLRAIEDGHGRVRVDRWGPRTLDLDLLLYGDLVLADDVLSLPHPNIASRGFVLVPLAEIAGSVVHPTEAVTIETLANRWRSEKRAERVVRMWGPEWCGSGGAA